MPSEVPETIDLPEVVSSSHEVVIPVFMESRMTLCAKVRLCTFAGSDVNRLTA